MPAIIIEEVYTPVYFCPKGCRQNLLEPGNCPVCGRELDHCEIYRVNRICNTCNKEFSASLDYFDNNKICPSCNVGVLIIKPYQNSHHVVVDGQWDSKDRSKVIQEKNTQLRERHAGYSYERQSIKEKTMKMAQERGII
jgi:DNA-directed RNA polymerase subunit RPC12/RpoP